MPDPLTTTPAGLSRRRTGRSCPDIMRRASSMESSAHRDWLPLGQLGDLHRTRSPPSAMHFTTMSRSVIIPARRLSSPRIGHAPTFRPRKLWRPHRPSTHEVRGGLREPVPPAPTPRTGSWYAGAVPHLRPRAASLEPASPMGVVPGEPHRKLPVPGEIVGFVPTRIGAVESREEPACDRAGAAPAREPAPHRQP